MKRNENNTARSTTTDYYYVFSPSSFTGKERDEETGYGYFGARYMDHELMTMWLSVDPMADKYPNISPYAYCAWNPVKLVDPDGREIWIGCHTDRGVRKYMPNHSGNKPGTLAGMLDKIYNGSKAGKYVITTLINSNNKYYISENPDPNGNGNPDYTNDNGCRQIYLNTSRKKMNEGILSHELFHAFQHEKEQWGQARSCELEAFVFAGIVLTQMNGGKLPISEMSIGMLRAFSVDKTTNKEKANAYCHAIMSLTKAFDSRQMNTAVSLFRCYSLAGSAYGDDRGYQYCLSGERYSGNSSLLNRYSSQLY